MDMIHVMDVINMMDVMDVTPSLITHHTRATQAAKFPGSGGAIIGMCRDPLRFGAVQLAFERAGYVFARIIPNI